MVALSNSNPTPARNCDGCAMCCYLGEIPDFKPYNQWCVHCSTRTRCDAYDFRPTPCRSFQCHYLLSDISEDWRPNICGMVVSTHSNPTRMTVQVDPAYPTRWQETPYLPQLQHWAGEGFVVVMIGEQAFAIYPERVEDLGIIDRNHRIEMLELETQHDTKRQMKRVAIS